MDNGMHANNSDKIPDIFLLVISMAALVFIIMYWR